MVPAPAYSARSGSPVKRAGPRSSRMLAAVGKLLVRDGLLCELQIQNLYQQAQSGRMLRVDQEFDGFVQRSAALHLHAAKLLGMEARRQRLLEQARKMRLANDKADAKKMTQKGTRRR